MKTLAWKASMLALAVASWAGATWWLPAVQAADPPAVGSGVPSSLNLKTQLEKGLKCRLPADFTYVANVVAMVECGTLPRSMVDSTFGWARHKPSDRRVQYFKFALRSRAAKLGVSI